MQTTANEAVLTPCLTRDDVLVHDGPDGVPVGYRKVARRAQVGEKVVFVKVVGFNPDWTVGEIRKVRDAHTVGTVFMEGVYIGALQSEYLVLEPLDPALYLVHDGEVYRKERRKAQAGELIVIPTIRGSARMAGFSIGEVLTAKYVNELGLITRVKEREINDVVYTDEYLVLTPLPNAAQSPTDAPLLATIRQHFPQMTLQNVLPTIALGMAARARDEYEMAEGRRQRAIVAEREAWESGDDDESIRQLKRAVEYAKHKRYWKREVERLEALAAWTEDENKQRMAAQDGAA